MDRGLMADATTTDDSPTPGYMLNEISRATTANYQTNVQIQDYLIARVQHKHHNVKFKALLIIKHVCRTGRPEFKREMQRKVDAIKECLQFKGSPDPLRGDEPNRRVREAAKEALDAIFDSQLPVTTSAVAAANRIQGMGNDWTPPEHHSAKTTGLLSSIVSSVSNAVMGDGTDIAYAGHPGAGGNLVDPTKGGAPGAYHSNYSGPPGGSSGSYPTTSSTSGMTGFGNPNFSDARQEKSWMQRASEYVASKPTSAPPPPVTFAAPLNSDYKYATNRGPNAYGAESSTSWQPAGVSVVPDLPLAAIGAGRAGGAASDGSYERSLVDNLCEPSGLKPVPNEHQLASFLQAAPSLSAELVGDALLVSLNSDAWQSRVKGLMVVLQLVQTNNCQSHMDFWCANIDAVEKLVQDGKAGVRTQANKVMKALGVDSGSVLEEVSSAKTPKVASNKAEAAGQNLLDMLDDGRSSSPFVPVTPAPTAIDTTDSLFAGLSLGNSASHLSPAPAPAPAASSSSVASDAFTGLSLPQSMPMSQSANSDAISNLDFLSDPMPVAPVSAMVQPPAAPAAVAVSSSDLFSGMLMQNSTQSSQPATSFDFMSGPTSGLSAPAAVHPSAQQAPGFSFMNQHVASAPYSASGHNISSAFVEQPKSNPSNAFQDLTATYMTPPSQPFAQPMAASQPLSSGYIGGAQGQPQTGFGFQQQAPVVYSSSPVRPGTSVLAPAMLNPIAARKDIPDAAAGPNSSFSFMGGRPAVGQSSGDSFSFVNDAMKTMTK